MTDELITRCPSCRTAFRVSADQLVVAAGSVRCGACLTVFQARDHDEREQADQAPRETPSATTFDGPADASDQASDQGAGRLSDKLQDEFADDLSDNVLDQSLDMDPGVESTVLPDEGRYRSISEPNALAPGDVGDTDGPDVFPEAGGDEDLAENEADPAEQLLLAEMDEYVPQEQTSVRRFLLWMAGSVLLLGLGAVQFLWFNLDRFAANEEYRSHALLICRYLGCQLPDYRAPELIRADELVIRSHPDVRDALVVDALIRNEGRFPQRFPAIHLRFLDKFGAPVAARTFEPRDYLGGEMRGLLYIPPQTEVRFELEINDPGTSAIGYDLDVVHGVSQGTVPGMVPGYASGS